MVDYPDFVMLSRLDRASAIARSAERLQRLCTLNAPAVIIEKERFLLAQRLAAFPIDASGLEERERIDALSDKEQQDFLHANGFYEEVQ